MKIYTNTEKFRLKNIVLTIGTFDGVHLGHKSLLNVLKNKAIEIEGNSAVFTFKPHPRKVLYPNEPPPKHLTDFEDKTEILAKYNINALILFPFTKAFSQLTAAHFFETVLKKKLNVKHLIIGHDHKLGADRVTSLPELRKIAKPLGIEVSRAKKFSLSEISISSTKIRNALCKGEITKANNYLGYQYNLKGTVVAGKKIGRTIGFPTANIQLQNSLKLVPAHGVYHATAKIGNKFYNGMLNIGENPTLYTHEKQHIEFHIFDFNKQIYGKEIILYLQEYIRPEIKFKNIKLLQQQLIKDKLLIQNIN